MAQEPAQKEVNINAITSDKKDKMVIPSVSQAQFAKNSVLCTLDIVERIVAIGCQ